MVAGERWGQGWEWWSTDFDSELGGMDIVPSAQGQSNVSFRSDVLQ